MRKCLGIACAHETLIVLGCVSVQVIKCHEVGSTLKRKILNVSMKIHVDA